MLGTVKIVFTITLLAYLGHTVLSMGYVMGAFFTYTYLTAAWLVNKAKESQSLL